MKTLFNRNIWRLVRAEFSYNLFMHVMLFLTLTFTFYLFGSLARNDVYTDPSIPHLIAVAIMYLLFTMRFTEKRVRFEHIIPVTLRELGLARFYSQGFYWFGAMIIYVGSVIATFPSEVLTEGLWRILALNALLIMGNAAFCLSFDLWATSSMPPFVKGLLISIIWIIIIRIGAVYLQGSLADLQPKGDIALITLLYKSPIGVFVQHAFAVFLSILSFKMYVSRQTFLT